VDNLLDMSRLRPAPSPYGPAPIGVDDVLPRPTRRARPGRSHRRPGAARRPARLYADPGLLERILANLVRNALRHSPPGRSPLVSGSTFGDRVELRVVDRGPGVAEADWKRIFVPFQRLGDRDNTTGVGLGWRCPRAGRGDGRHAGTGAHPGGGLTMVLALPAVPSTRPVPQEVTDA